MKLSVRIAKAKSTSGQAAHDFSQRPIYVNGTKTALNQTIFGGTHSDVLERIEAQKKSIITVHNDFIKMKKSGQKNRALGGWRKNTATHQTAIITFDRDFREQKSVINKDDLDRCALNFFTQFCRENNCALTYIVRHEDEATPHYHAMFTNYNEALNRPHRFAKKNTSEMQDLAGKHFSSLGIERGMKRAERLTLAHLTSEPQRLNESDQDYNNRIYRAANVIHRNVDQLHLELPKEINELIMQRDGLIEEVARNKKYINRLGAQLKRVLGDEARPEDTVVDRLVKLEGLLTRYVSQKTRDEATLVDLNKKITHAMKIYETWNQKVRLKHEAFLENAPDHLKNKISHLETENQKLTSENQMLRARLERDTKLERGESPENSFYMR